MNRRSQSHSEYEQPAAGLSSLTASFAPAGSPDSRSPSLEMKIRKPIAGMTAVSGFGVAFVTGIVVAGYWKNPAQRDLLITLPPIIIPAILSILAVMTMISISRSRKQNGALMGMCVGSLLYLLFPALQLALRYDMIVHDGTGFWALIMLPSVYFGIPLPILGALIGLTIGFITDRITMKP